MQMPEKPTEDQVANELQLTNEKGEKLALSIRGKPHDNEAL